MRALDTYAPLADYFSLTELERAQSRNAVLKDGRDESYWNNMVQWARRKLNERGYLTKSLHGYWKLSEKGAAKAKSLSSGSLVHVVYPDEPTTPTVEGAKKQVVVNRYERNPAARQKCIEHYGYKCSACEMNFEKSYSERGRYLIHVHHIIPLSSIGETYEVDPIKDLRPICPNCHAVIHRTEPPCSIEELKELIKTSNF